jgi:hypothetical protein
MIYLLTDQKAKQDAVNYMLTLPEDGTFEAVMQEYIKKRSLAQNRLYHMWKPYVAKVSGYTLDEMHDEFKYAFIGSYVYTNRKGVLREKPLSTASLSVPDFVIFLNKIEATAKLLKITLPLPHDYEFAMMRD